MREAAREATGGAEHVTVSIGVALLGDAPDEPVAAIAAADAAMYDAKRAGGDTVRLAATRLPT